MSAAPLEQTLRDRVASGRSILVPYVTGGLGGDEWLNVLAAMADAGADAIEVGLPFSDPVMDGPTIQAASQAALDAGATPEGILSSLRGAEVGVPLVAMTYYNLVFRAGHERFAALLCEAGVTGAIVPDLPLEESAAWERDAAAAGVAPVLLAAPVTPDDRLEQIAQRSRGFVYAVSVMGVTGERAAVAASAVSVARRLKRLTETPVLVGFGVSTPAQAVELSRDADGVVVASALMRIVLDGGAAEDVGEAVAAMRSALDEAHPG